MAKIANKIIKKFLIEKSYLTGKYSLSPQFLSLLITFKCNLQCKTCSIWKKTNYSELSKNKWLEIASNLSVLSPKTFVEINGGEPLIHKDLVLNLIKKLKKHFKNIALNSNGLLIDRKIVSELEKIGLNTVKISFYSLKKDIHNSLRGNSQAYDKALNALKLLSKSKIDLEVGILITSENIKSIPDLIKYLRELGNTSIVLQPLDESIESSISKNKNINTLLTNLWPKEKDVVDFFDSILNNHQQIKNSLDNIKAIRKYYLNPQEVLNYRCFAGQRSLIIYPNGNTSFCFKGSAFGNLKEKSLDKILKSQQAIKERKNIKNCKKYCRIVGCNFSRGFVEFIRDKTEGCAELVRHQSCQPKAGRPWAEKQ